MNKKLILGLSLLFLGNKLQAMEMDTYRNGYFHSVQEIKQTVDNIYVITERLTYTNPQTRLVVKKLHELKELSQDIALTFEAMDVCVAAGGVLAGKITEVKNCVEIWEREGFSRESTALLNRAIDEFENVYWGNWTNSEYAILDTQFFSSMHKRLAKEQLKDLRDTRVIESEIMQSNANMAESERRIAIARTETNRVVTLSPLTTQKSIVDLTRSIEEDKLAIESAKQKREFLPYEADLQMIKNYYDLAGKHVALLKLKTELEHSEAVVAHKRAEVLRANAEATRAQAEAEKFQAEARYAEIRQEIARQEAEIKTATSFLTFIKTAADTVSSFDGEKK